MVFPQSRPRRLRSSKGMRDLVRENSYNVFDLVYPLFVIGGKGIQTPISSMPGIYQLSVDKILLEIKELTELGIRAIFLFGIPSYKDSRGTSAYDPNETLQRAVTAIKHEFPDMLVITDVCLCGFMNHGHCGIVNEREEIINDATLEVLAKIALSQVRAGSDMVAPSDMMDGRVAAIRTALDGEGYSQIPIMSYSVKYASAFYGPFRDAAECAPQFGDRRTYQMDPANAREALKEVEEDIAEGADIVIVKPALAYLDIIRLVKEKTSCPVAAYSVSGEYSMVKAASLYGWLDERKIVSETLVSMKRAGADIIITYHAKEAARWLMEEKSH